MMQSQGASPPARDCSAELKDCDRQNALRPDTSAGDALDMIMPMLKAGKLAEAAPYLEAINKSEPGNAAVLYNLGISYSELTQFDEAIIRLKRAVKIDPVYWHAWVGIGVAYHRLRKPEQAFEAYREALRINPNDGYTQRNLGSLLMSMKRPSESLPHLRQALSLMPEDPQAIFGLALCLCELETVDADREADGLFNRIIKEHPTSPVVEHTEKGPTRLAHKGLQEGAVGGLHHRCAAHLRQSRPQGHATHRPRNRLERPVRPADQ